VNKFFVFVDTKTIYDSLKKKRQESDAKLTTDAAKGQGVKGA
jgi:hypothetical protein